MASDADALIDQVKELLQSNGSSHEETLAELNRMQAIVKGLFPNMPTHERTSFAMLIFAIGSKELEVTVMPGKGTFDGKPVVSLVVVLPNWLANDLGAPTPEGLVATIPIGRLFSEEEMVDGRYESDGQEGEPILQRVMITPDGKVLFPEADDDEN